MRCRYLLPVFVVAGLGGLLYACGENDGEPPEEDAGADTRPDVSPGQDARIDRRGDVPSEASDGGTDARDDAADTDANARDAPVDAPVDVDTDADAGEVADADAGPLAPTVFVIRVGGTPDAGPLANETTAVYLEERKVSDGSVVATIPMPTEPNGAHLPFTLSGTQAGYEGKLLRSIDGHYLTLAGFGVGPGTVNPTATTASTVPRVVARVDATKAVDTTTSLGADYSAAAPSGALTNDGTSFWCFGGSNKGIRVVPFGSGADGGAVTTEAILSSPFTVYSVRAFDGQLWASGQVSWDSVYAVGTGLPTTGTHATTATIPTGDFDEAHDFVLFDRDPSVPGLDTMYVANYSPIGTSGVQKWTYNGTSWTLVTTFADGLTIDGVRSLTGYEDGGDVVLIGTTKEVSTRLVSYVDDGVTLDPPLVVLATAPSNSFFRGVALAPVP